MAQASKMIRVPRAKESSYNPNRPLSNNTLLLNQVKHFLEAEKKLPPEQQTGAKLEDFTTEAHASEYVSRVTAIFHPQVAKIGGA
jgi:hypothetical protein